jgi:hypothetical protein
MVPGRTAFGAKAAPGRSGTAQGRHGNNGGKKIQGVKIHVAVNKYGIPLAIDVSPANRHDTKGIVPVLRTLAEGGFQGAALGDLGYRGERLANVGEALGITVEAILSPSYSTGCAG